MPTSSQNPEPERLTPARLDEIRSARYTQRSLAAADVDIDALLTEIDRLRAQVRFLLEQVRRKDAASGEGNRALAEFLAAESPCDLPNACDPDTGEPCDRHEREAAHAEGEHAFCGDECAAQTGGAS